MKVKLILGDWSGDGHAIEKEVLLESNKEIFEIQEAYKASCKLTGLQFSHNKNYTGLPDHDRYGTDRHILTEYESNGISELAYQILRLHILNIEEIFEDFDKKANYHQLSIDSFVKLWIAFTKLSLSDLELEVIEEKDDIPVINGYWNKNLNDQFGYGLFIV